MNQPPTGRRRDRLGAPAFVFKLAELSGSMVGTVYFIDRAQPFPQQPILRICDMGVTGFHPATTSKEGLQKDSQLQIVFALPKCWFAGEAMGWRGSFLQTYVLAMDVACIPHLRHIFCGFMVVLFGVHV